MNAIELLTKQHRAMESEMQAVVDARGEARSTLFEKAADSLMTHLLSEEQHFYPAVKAKRTEDILLESLEEHLSLKRVLADLLALAPSDTLFDPKLHVLKEQIEHHHEEEEEKLFPKAKLLLTEGELQELGARMSEAQASLLASRPRRLVVTQTAAASELP